MNQGKATLFVLAGLVLLLSCTKESGSGVDEPIVFSARLVESTKAQGAVSSQGSFTSGGFGVFACYTADHTYSESSVSPDFMYNEHLIWDATHGVWTYAPIKYWPNGEGEAESVHGEIPHYVSFFAYAPYSNANGSSPALNPSGYCISSFINSYEQDNPWILYRLHPDVSKQVDLMYAVPLLDQTKGSVAEKLQFSFKHALGCVGDAVDVVCATALANTLKDKVDSGTPTWVRLFLSGVSIRYTLTEKGKLTLWNQGQANWSPVLSENSVTTRDVILLDSETLLYSYDGSSETSNTWADDNHGVFFIPLQVSGEIQKADITVSYVIRYSTGEEVTNTRTSTLYITTDKYQEGKDLSIHITLSNM